MNYRCRQTLVLTTLLLVSAAVEAENTSTVIVGSTAAAAGAISASNESQFSRVQPLSVRLTPAMQDEAHESGNGHSPGVAHHSDTIRPETRIRVNQALDLAARGQAGAGTALCNALARNELNRAESRLVENCVQFDIPLLTLRDYMANDRMQAADELVDDMLRGLADDSPHRGYLKQVRQITSAAAREEDPESPGALVMRRIIAVLDRYRQASGVYPRSYGELNAALPANAPPLVDYDIIDYLGNEQGFSIKIRSRTNSDEILSLHKSSLLK